jgi:hypothetical protein
VQYDQPICFDILTLRGEKRIWSTSSSNIRHFPTRTCLLSTILLSTLSSNTSYLCYLFRVKHQDLLMQETTDSIMVSFILNL